MITAFSSLSDLTNASVERCFGFSTVVDNEVVQWKHWLVFFNDSATLAAFVQDGVISRAIISSDGSTYTLYEKDGTVRASDQIEEIPGQPAKYRVAFDLTLTDGQEHTEALEISQDDPRFRRLNVGYCNPCLAASHMFLTRFVQLERMPRIAPWVFDCGVLFNNTLKEEKMITSFHEDGPLENGTIENEYDFTEHTDDALSQLKFLSVYFTGSDSLVMFVKDSDTYRAIAASDGSRYTLFQKDGTVVTQSRIEGSPTDATGFTLSFDLTQENGEKHKEILTVYTKALEFRSRAKLHCNPYFAASEAFLELITLPHRLKVLAPWVLECKCLPDFES